MKDEKTDIAKELSRICKEKGISRYSLSKRTGIPDSTLQNYENGTTPNFSTLEIICEALGTTIAGFFQSDCFSYFTEEELEAANPDVKSAGEDGGTAAPESEAASGAAGQAAYHKGAAEDQCK